MNLIKSIFRPIGKVASAVLRPFVALLGKFWQLVMVVIEAIWSVIWAVFSPILKPIGRFLGKTPLGTLWEKLAKYFRGSAAELKKVTWPSKKDTWAMAAVVFIFTTILTIFIVIVDGIFGILMRRLIS